MRRRQFGAIIHIRRMAAAIANTPRRIQIITTTRFSHSFAVRLDNSVALQPMCSSEGWITIQRLSWKAILPYRTVK